MMAESSPAQSAGSLVEHFFRHESANLIAVLTRAFGLRRIELVEDMVQQAMLEAMNTWKHKGLPNNPAGWIHTAAQNRIRDALRRESVHARAIALSGQTEEATESLVEHWLEEEQLPDSLLRMMFVCCHPTMTRESQIASALKILCGFSVAEISRGLLTSEETIRKRIQRARKKLSAELNSFELPTGSQIGERLSVVHDVLYLMFNEGYSTSHGHDPIRDDLCEEAARLCHLLCLNEIGTQTTYALLALMLLHGARLDSRVIDGAVVLMEDQDRSKWDHNLIDVATSWLSRSGEPTSRFHLEAGIAMLHCRAPRFESTDWKSIIGLYDRLLSLVPSPVYRLNRAIAMGESGAIEMARMELTSVASDRQLQAYYLVHCAQARLYALESKVTEAIDCYEQALEFDVAQHERDLLNRKIERLQSGC